MGLFSSRGHAGARGYQGDAGDSAVRIRFRFVGHVQAVGFRWNTAKLAKEAGATGWVRNERDGSVTAEIQGIPSQVDAVVDGLERVYNDSDWSQGFQIAAREYLPLVPGETELRIARGDSAFY
jgi:acylphosphatase